MPVKAIAKRASQRSRGGSWIEERWRSQRRKANPATPNRKRREAARKGGRRASATMRPASHDPAQINETLISLR